MSEKTIDYRTKEQKRADRKESARRMYEAAMNELHKNGDVLVPITIAGLTAVGGVCKLASAGIKRNAVNKEIDYKNRTIYDRSLGRYIELKKPLTNIQALEIEERRRDGERLVSILDDMNLLKRR